MLLDVSFGLEIVEHEAQADAQKPGIHPLLHFTICIVLENKLCEHKLSPNRGTPPPLENMYTTFLGELQDNLLTCVYSNWGKGFRRKVRA